MSYYAQVRGGVILTDTKDQAEKILYIMGKLDIDAEIIKSDVECTIDVYSSTSIRYGEECFQPIADMGAKKGSFLRFWGEDDNVYTLKFQDGLVVDCPGEVLWDTTKKDLLSKK